MHKKNVSARLLFFPREKKNIIRPISLTIKSYWYKKYFVVEESW